MDTRYTFEAAESLRGFDKPALVLWADGDKIFPRDHGRRLAELLPQGRFDMVRDSRTFIPEDQPERLVAAVRSFLPRRGQASSARPTLSATQHGFSEPSTSTVNRVTTCHQPPPTSSTETTSAFARTRLPAGTGAGKRTLFQP